MGDLTRDAFGDSRRDDFGDGPLVGGYVVDDSSPSRLAIVWQGPPPYLQGRMWGGVALVFVLALVAFWLAASGWSLIAGALAGPNWDEILLGGLFLSILTGFVISCFSFLGTSLTYDREYVWDGAEQRFTIGRQGWLVWGRRGQSDPLGKITQFRAIFGREGMKPLELEFWMRVPAASPEDPDYRIFKLAIAGLVRRSQALELLLKIGRAIGAQGYLVDEEQVSRAVVELVLAGDRRLDPSWKPQDDWDEDDGDLEDEEEEDEEEDEEEEDEDDDYQDYEPGERPKVHALPGPGQPPPRPMGTRADPQAAYLRGLPAYAKPSDPVDVPKLTERMMFSKILAWRPGEEIAIERPDPPKFVYVAALLFGGALGGVIGYWPLCGVISIVVSILTGAAHLNAWGFAAFGVALGAALAVVFAYNRLRARELRLHWHRRQMTERVGDRQREWPLTAIRGVVFTPLRRQTQDDSPNQVSRSQYGGRLDLILSDESEVLLFETDRWEEEGGHIRQLLAPLGHELAEQLGVPYLNDVEGAKTQDSDRIAWLDFSPLQKAVLGGILAVGLGGLVYAGTNQRHNSLSKERIRAAGAEVVNSGYHGPGNRTILKDYNGVRFKEGTPDEAFWGLRDSFAQLPDLGVHLEKCAISDRAMEQFSNLPNLKLLILADTRVGDLGVAALGDAPSLVFLDLTNTEVSDEGLEHVGQLTSLKFLYLPMARHVTDLGIDKLHRLTKLELLILPQQVSEEAYQRLKKALPHVHIIQPGRIEEP